MHSIKKKLNSSTGSSLFLAIAFFMFAFFVGGTVLAAATANAGRLTNLEEEREAYYRQRNMAMILQQIIGEDPIKRPSVNVGIRRTQTLTAENPKTAFDLKPKPGSLKYTSTAKEENCDNVLLKCLKNYIYESAIGVYKGNNDFDIESDLVGGAAASGTITIDGMKASYECQFDFSNLDKFGKIEFVVMDNDQPGQFKVTVPVKAYKNEANGSEKPEYKSEGTNSYYSLIEYKNTSYVVTLGSAVIGKNTDEKTVEVQP